MMKRTIIALGGGLILLSQSATAALIASTLDFRIAQNVSGGVNLGGLMTTGAGALFANNGDDLLNFQITIDDTADTGAVFTSILTVSGQDGAGGNRIVYLAPGIVNFLSGASAVRQNTLFVSMGTPTQVSGPAANISFDGFSGTKFSNWTAAGTDAMSFDGTTYNATVGDQGIITFGSLAQSGTFTALPSGNFRQDEIHSQFTVTVIPEPTSALLLGLGGLGFMLRRCRV